MIRVMIGEVDYSDYVSTGFSIVERLDEQLDEGNMTLFATTKEDEFTPNTSVAIYDNNKVKGMLVSDDNVTIASRNPLRYTHELTLVEVTKKLERFKVDGKTFTQPIDENSGYEPYTLYDVVKILRDTVPLRDSGEFDGSDEPTDKQIFEIPPDTQQILEDVIAPEFNLSGTLRDALDEVVSYLDANVYLDYKERLHLNLFNQRKGEIDKDFVDRTLNRSIENYSTNIESAIMNAVSTTSRGEVNIETAPSVGTYTTSRTEDTVWDYTNAFIPTQNPIYKGIRVNTLANFKVVHEKWNYDTQQFEYEGEEEVVKELIIEDALLEDKQAERLDVASGIQEVRNNPNTLYANTSLVYTYGNKNVRLPKIQTFFTLYEALNLTLDRSWYLGYESGDIRFVPEDEEIRSYEYDYQDTDDLLILTGTRPTDDGPENRYLINRLSPTTSDINNNELSMNVEYQAVKPTVRTSIEVSGISDTPYKSILSGNQNMKIVDVPRYLDKNQGLVDRLGLADMIAVDVVKSGNDLLDLGDIDLNGFILTQREIIFFKDHLRAVYQLNKGFNKRNQYAGIDSEERQWEIGEAGRTVERRSLFEEYIEIDGVSQNEQVSGDNNSITLQNNSTAKILTTFDRNPIIPVNYKPLRQAVVRAQLDLTVEDTTYTTPYLYIPFTPYAGGNQINLHFNINENGSAGYYIQRIVRWTDSEAYPSDGLFSNSISRYEQIPAMYVDEDGRITDLDFAFTDYDPSEDGALVSYAEFVKQGDANPIVIPFETTGGANNLDAFKQVEGNIRLMKDNREKIALSLIYHFVSLTPDIIVGNYLPRRNKLISLANNDDLTVFFYDRELGSRDKEKLPTDYLSSQDSDISINYDNYYIDVNNTIPSEAVSYAIAGIGRETFLIVNDTSMDRLVFDFERNRTGVTYKFIDADDSSIEANDFAFTDYSESVFTEENVVNESINVSTDSQVGNATFHLTAQENDITSVIYTESVFTEENIVNEEENVNTASHDNSVVEFDITVTESDTQSVSVSPSIYAEEKIVNTTDNVPTDSDFTPETLYELTYQAEGPGQIIGDDEGTYQEGGSIFVQAEPFSGYSFSHWESNVSSLDGNTNQVLSFNISQDTDLTAIFN